MTDIRRKIIGRANTSVFGETYFNVLLGLARVEKNSSLEHISPTLIMIQEKYLSLLKLI